MYSFVFTCACRIQNSGAVFYSELEKGIPENIVLPTTPGYSLLRVLKSQETLHFYEIFPNFDKCDPNAKSDDACFTHEICRDFNWF